MPKSQKNSSPKSEGKPEKLWRLARNINVIGAAALIGAGVLLPPAAASIALAWGTVNAGQAGFFEVMRRHAEKSRKKKETS